MARGHTPFSTPEAPAISVAIVAYAHERYIACAVESVLAQQIDRPYEVVIGDDCSPDGTRAVLTRFAEAHPGIIRLLPSGPRVGAQRNFMRTLSACRGRYIALLEGDDYWTSPHKLRRQADYLDAHPQCALCFHNVEMQGPDGSRLMNPPDQKPESTVDDLLRHNFLATCSVMYRAGLFPGFPTWFAALPCGDWPLHVLNAQHGSIGYLDEVMGVYRRHGAGLYSALSTIDRLEMRLACYPALRAQVGRAHRPAVRAGLADVHGRLAWQYAAYGSPAAACRHALHTLVLDPWRCRHWLTPLGRFVQRRLHARLHGAPGL